MGSSPGFGSTPSNFPEGIALFRLAFAAAPPVPWLNLATESNSPAHSSIGTPLPPPEREASTACRHAVSGTISLPSRGAFHLSLTVLVHYRSSWVFSLGGWSPRLPTGFLVSRGTQEHRREPRPLSLTGLSPSLVARSRVLLLEAWLVTPSGPLQRPGPSLTTPAMHRSADHSVTAGLGFSPFARRYSGNDLFSSGY
jgi:hypothetical protein